MALQLQAPTDRPDLSPERNFCRPPSSQPASSQASRIETPTNQQPPQPSAHSWSVPAPQHLARFASLLPSFRSALYPRFGLSPGNQSVLETCLGAPRGIPSPPRCVQPACRQAHHLRTWEEIDASGRRSFLPQGQKIKRHRSNCRIVPTDMLTSSSPATRPLNSDCFRAVAARPWGLGGGRLPAGTGRGRHRPPQGPSPLLPTFRFFRTFWLPDWEVESRHPMLDGREFDVSGCAMEAFATHTGDTKWSVPAADPDPEPDPRRKEHSDMATFQNLPRVGTVKVVSSGRFPWEKKGGLRTIRFTSERLENSAEL